ncbi:unnamed protein product [Cylicostephanus goldi]|uniref:Uncharacterized protein n=1 Tax=Cylicostephanus goldi TaxID=71465 RepID=A0A3P7M3B3_CYLGO|nr:unnamed protein product [Cylicostephanus goldi]
MTSPSPKTVRVDRLPLPVTISFIRAKAKEGETVRIGNKEFPTVICVGRVVSCRPVRTLNSLQYVVCDSPEGSVTMNQVSVLDRNELICPEEYDCIKMEAFLAVQYHMKNPAVLNPMRRSMQGTPLPKSSSSPLTTPSPRNIPRTTPSSAPAKRLSCPTPSNPTPKRPNVANSSSARRPINSTPAQRSLGTTKTETVNQKTASKEAGSQDSFEDENLISMAFSSLYSTSNPSFFHHLSVQDPLNKLLETQAQIPHQLKLTST